MDYSKKFYEILNQVIETKGITPGHTQVDISTIYELVLKECISQQFTAPSTHMLSNRLSKLGFIKKRDFKNKSSSFGMSFTLSNTLKRTPRT